jgi:hypothetical protein
MEDFLLDALRERPTLFAQVRTGVYLSQRLSVVSTPTARHSHPFLAQATYFAAHPYPAQQWQPLDSPANWPLELGGNASWMAEVKQLRMLVADSWATNRSHSKQDLLDAR